ncbi:hypothetical protein J2Z21_004247 [Streptomyces griseochromogenes]|uniref:UL36 very large tegument protein n=1 Tax=Streptomyces griseochromogenes TaxID=68214 RepID=A0A1B1AVE9_9ACTN|nr:hypothetical protein [Streptomyces griseochromogenes]ANP50517.1 hypothetical protein AVL59_13595 [Streptomyces griseochromogenes]MBP2051276.1 hypothetical protein [Streptomyces griseochromogenes]
MAVDQLPGPVREFANYLDGLLGRLDQGGGWCGVFWQRDPDGMRACLDGHEVPPWDVLESLLEDLAAAYGPAAAGAERKRARLLRAAAVSAYDALPGARDTLGDRLDVMLREQRYAAERQAGLSRLLTAATTREEADALRVDLAWARDDQERADARCAELRRRTADLDRRAVEVPVPDAPLAWSVELDFEGPRGAGEGAAAPGGHGAAGGDTGTGGAATTVPARPRKRRRGSARFAGMAEDEVAPAVVPRTGAVAVPEVPAGRRTPRGARFAGAAEADVPVRVPAGAVDAGVVDAEAGAAVAGAVEKLERLRAQGLGGEAHVLLVEIAHWPAARLPLLADGLHRAGLGADWATLLWEAASLPAERLIAAADALRAAGRAADGQEMLRQGVARPAAEIGAAVLGLAAEGRLREVRALLDAYVRVRTPEEAARSAAADPGRLVPLLLEAARGVSEERHWDLVHAVRVAGFTA